MYIIINWLLSAVAILITAYLLPGVMLSGLGAALIVALILGILNAVIRPILIVLTLPVNILTLGLFTFVINALIIMLTSAVTAGFQVANFWTALVFGLVLVVISYVIHLIVPNALDRPAIVL